MSTIKVITELRNGALVGGLLACLFSFQAAAQGESVSGGYKLGPGDQISITVFGEDDLSMDFRLNDSGVLNYPYLGELKLEGLSAAELEQLIAQGLKKGYLVDPDVTVSILEYRPFFLDGEVAQPGGIPYQPGLTLQRAIALGGGYTPRAAKNKVTVLRAADPTAKPVTILPNDPVYPGDVIFVGERYF